MAQWFVVRGGEEQGPLTAAELKAMAGTGKLTPSDLVRRGDLSAPQQARLVKGLFPTPDEKVGKAAEAAGRAGDTVKKVAKHVGKVADAVNELAETTEKLRQAASSIAGIAGGVSALAGSVGDFLRPFGNINLMAFLLAGGATPVLAFLAYRQSNKSSMLKYGIAAVSAVVMSAIFGLWTGLSAVAGKDDRGVLASNVQPIDRLQASVLPAKQVEPPSPPPPPAPKDDLARMQGRWFSVAEEVVGRTFSEKEVQAMHKVLDVQGNTFRIERTIGGTRGVYEGVVRLRDAESPKQFDWDGTRPGGAPAELHGIYEMTDEVFKICYTTVLKDAEYSRPERFDTSGGKSLVFVTFKRSPLPEQPATGPAARPGIDLLQRVKLQRDVVRGDWRMVDGGLRAKSGEEGGTGAALLLPYPLKGNYTLHLVASRNEGFGGMVVPVICSGKQFGAYLSGGWKGSSIPVTTEKREVDFFPSEEKTRIECVVRPEGVVLSNGDAAKIEWSDWDSVRGTGKPGDVPENCLWLKVWGNYTFYEIRLVEQEN